MKNFFYPSNIAVFGVADHPRNLGKNILLHCLEMGFEGELYAVGKRSGQVFGKTILTDPYKLPHGIDLAVILIPAKYVAEALEACGQKGIRNVIISTGGFRELSGAPSKAEKEVLSVARHYGIRFIGPNCIGVICPESGVCTPFNPIQAKRLQPGHIGLIIQSGGVTTQAAYYFSEEYVGFSKLISAGNKLDLNENDFLEYLISDDETRQIHLYLESIDDGRRLLKLARSSPKPIVIFKSNVTRTAATAAYSHTAAIANDDRVVEGALRQAGVLRVDGFEDLVVAAKALALPPLKGNRLAVLSFSGGFSVILADACENNGFTCPSLPKELVAELERYRRAGVIRLSNPMDLGDIHDLKGLVMALRGCLELDIIDGVVLGLLYERQIERIFGRKIGAPRQILEFLRSLALDKKKPIALSLFAQKRDIEEFKKFNHIFPVFNNPAESVRALAFLREYWRHRT